MDVQEYINSKAEKYYNAKISQNEAQMKTAFNEIVLKIYEPNRISNSMIKKFIDYNNVFGNGYCGYDRSDALNDAVLFIGEHIKEYDFSKNSNFTAWILTTLHYKLNNLDSKQRTQKGTKETDGSKGRLISSRTNNTIYDSKGNEQSLFDNMEDTSDYYSGIESRDVKEINTENRIKLLSIITLFNTRKGRSANPVRLSYYRIFVTESITKDIRENNTTKIYEFANKNELMQAIDAGYLRFVAFTDMNVIEDIITMKIKKYKDIIENGNDKEIALNREPQVIIAYREYAELDNKEVTTANVSRFIKLYKKEIESIFRKKETVC